MQQSPMCTSDLWESTAGAATVDTVVGAPAMAETAMGDQEVRWAAQMVAAAMEGEE